MAARSKDTRTHARDIIYNVVNPSCEGLCKNLPAVFLPIVAGEFRQKMIKYDDFSGKHLKICKQLFTVKPGFC